LQFGCFVVTDRKENAASAESKGQARILGECILELQPLMSQLNDVYGVGVRQQLAFGRRRDGNDVTVGRFSVQLKIVGDYLAKFENFDGAKLSGPRKANGQVHLMPAEEPQFKWRVRV